MQLKRFAAGSELINHRAARVAQTEEAGDFVVGFTCGVVKRERAKVLDAALRVGDGIAVGIALRMAQVLIEAIDEAIPTAIPSPTRRAASRTLACSRLTTSPFTPLSPSSGYVTGTSSSVSVPRSSMLPCASGMGSPWGSR